ncbi:hypothetical protein OC68_20925 [Salmonella enterica subsp. enterica serovar Newport]|nr:hypothetical protein LFZ8_08175 [Salmonella enterica subsp. enterica serovar Djakarta str. S-1087]ECF6887007.1 hypothetical protein [Salmonella enterica subsp. enterica]ECM1979562.1 hypothetical protein [Salmonella enterica subsp. enterica serovar Newport]EDT7239341.1 hypothetical protein [Salmonella enterica subsp. enterica serovar Warragul]EGI6011881.1 hypothetical protein [Salmonella enterica subsp. enterica serovar Bangkok]
MQNGAEPAGASSLKNIIPDIALPVQKTFSQTVKMTVLVFDAQVKGIIKQGATRRVYSKH